MQAWEVASLTGDVDAIMRLTAPNFMGWNLEMPAPVDRAAYRAEQSGFFGHFKVLQCARPITAIQVEHDTAAAHGRYRETVQDPTGARLILQGSWTASLHRKGGQWRFLSLGCLADPPTTDEAAIKAEVGAALDAFKAAVAKVDLAATLGAAAEVPEFRYTTDDGAVMDFAGWKQGHIEYFPTVTSHRFIPKSQDLAVLGPDAALVTWSGAMEITPKDGAVLRIDPFSATFVFKRFDGSWKLVCQHESGAPAKPVASAVTPAAKVTTGP